MNGDPESGLIAIKSFQAAWESGEAPAIDAFLPDDSDDPGSRLSLLIELIKIDLDQQWRNGVSDHRSMTRSEVLTEIPRLEDQSC